MLEEISFFLPADIYRFINNEAMVSLFIPRVSFTCKKTASWNIPENPFISSFSNWNSSFLPINYCLIGECFYFAGYSLSFVFFSLVWHRASNFFPVTCCCLYIYFNTQLINRALLANQRAISKLFFNLMKSEMKRELSFRLKWKDRVKNWKLTQKNYIVQSFRYKIL